MRPKFLEAENEEELEQYLQDREQMMNDMEDHDGEYYRQALLPSLRDPKIFFVPCKRSKEKEYVIRILNKYAHVGAKMPECEIFSVSAIDRHPGYIFVEANDKYYVRKFLEDFEGLMLNKITLVQVEDVPKVFAPKDIQQVNIRENEWVRVKRGLYDGDIAQVMRVLNNNNVEVRIMARIEPPETRRKQKAHSDESDEEMDV